jgi:hopanoid biosynthesis associated protein HpnK
MVGAPAAADAIARARSLPGLRVGLHVVLVDGVPTADRAQIPALLDGKGNLRDDLGSYGAQIAFSAAVRQQVETEIVAQFEAYRTSGLPLDHVDGHRHFQLHPVVAAIIMRVGKRYGMRALRVPVEPWRIVTEIDPQTRRLLGRIAAPLAIKLRRRVRAAGLTAADAVFGLAWSGALTRARLAALLDRLPPGLIEIYLHPATVDAFVGAAPGYRYADEFAALCDADCVAAARRSGYPLGGYADAAAVMQ